MSRKIISRPWLPFQKPSSEVESTPDRSDSSSELSGGVLLDDEDSSESAPPEPIRKSFYKRFPTQLPKQYAAQAATVMSAKSQAALKRMGPWAAAWKWQLIVLAMLTGAGLTGAGALFWLSKAPPAVDCKQGANWSTTESEQLFCAQEAAQSGRAEELLKAIALVKDWTPENSLYTQSQGLLQDWSNAVLILARDRMAQRDLDGAVSLANQIPKSSPSYKDAQASIERWQEERKRGQVLFDKIQAELKKQNWDTASQLIGELSLNNDPGWQDRLTEIRQQANNEKVAWKALKDAQAFAKNNPPDQLGQAIALVDPIDRKTYVWSQAAQAEVTKWRNSLFDQALAQLDKANIPAASTLINSIPKSVQLTAANVDFIRLIRGKEAEASQDFSTPSLEKVVPLAVATHLVRQIGADSPFYSRAKTLLPKLEAQLQDVTALNWSAMLANLQQIPALKVATEQATAIKPGRPARLYAQTLLAQWQKELQWQEDRPIVKQARQVAKSGKLEELRSAVALVNLVKPNRALRQEAQTDAAEWTYQIQVIEDRPIIAEAKSVASSGRLGAAIDVASKIRPGRALYGEAQNLIGGWVYEIQLAEDRSTLAQADGLASQGSLSRAIEVASYISPGRPLYREAQASIGRWTAQRTEIWRQRERQYTPPAPAPYNPPPAPAEEYYPPEPQNDYPRGGGSAPSAPRSAPAPSDPGGAEPAPPP